MTKGMGRDESKYLADEIIQIKPNENENRQVCFCDSEIYHDEVKMLHFCLSP